MSNMSYCRFRNTVEDLGDCQEALEELLQSGAPEPLSAEELRAAQKLVRRCIEISSFVREALGDLDFAELEDDGGKLTDALLAKENDAAREAAELAERESETEEQRA